MIESLLYALVLQLFPGVNLSFTEFINSPVGKQESRQTKDGKRVRCTEGNPKADTFKGEEGTVAKKVLRVAYGSIIGFMAGSNG